MMLKNISISLINQILILLLIVNPMTSLANNDIEVEERTLEKINTFLKTSEPSDIPFIDYNESFINEIGIKILNDFDLSSYEGKKIFSGYGIYDSNQNYCKYVELTENTEELSMHFEKVHSFNNHTYARSLSTKTYDECLALTEQFGGSPFIPNNAAENSFVNSVYSYDLDDTKTKWIGISRDSCDDNYYNEGGFGKAKVPQTYFNWSSTDDGVNVCEDGKFNVVQNGVSTWEKISNASEYHYCIMEVDSEDITKPIKICAPWWKVEREYESESDGIYAGVDIYRINQADIPLQMSICTKYADSEDLEAYEQSGNRYVTCTSYYSTVIAEGCLINPYQEICFVDECNGYIKNACRLEENIEPYKDYTKAEVIQDSARTITTGKVNIQTHAYSCPASLPSMSTCQEKSTVLVYPKECPGSRCAERKDCLLSATDTETTTKLEEQDKCEQMYPCEKIYPNEDAPRVMNNGEIEYLTAYCQDGTQLQFEPNIQRKEGKKCVKYDTYTVTEEITQRCEEEKTSSEKTVYASLTDEDIYMTNPNCVRINNVVDAREYKDLAFEFTNRKHSKIVVKKSLLDGVNLNQAVEGDDGVTVLAATDDTNAYAEEEFEDNTLTAELNIDTSMCADFTEPWYLRNDLVLNNEFQGLTVSKIIKDTNGNVYGVYDTDSALICSKIATDLQRDGFDDIKEVDEVDLCYIQLQSYPGSDIFSEILPQGSLNSYSDPEDGEYKEWSSYLLTTSATMNSESCREYAYCMDGEYNKAELDSSVNGANCKITMGEDITYTEEAFDIPDFDVYEPSDIDFGSDFDENCKPIPSTSSAAFALNGLTDVYSIQEVVTGGFGYYSNFNYHPFLNSSAKVNELNAYPIEAIPIITDDLIYDSYLQQVSITTKSPNFVAGALGGAAAGGIAKFVLDWGAAGITIAVIVVFAIFTAIFGKKIKLNEQTFDWSIYKLLNQSYYSANPYGYDQRTIDGLNEVGELKIIYAELSGFTGTMKPGAFKEMLTNLSTQKITLLTCMGWPKSTVENLMLTAESDIVVGYPKCKRFSFSCNKRNAKEFTKLINPFGKESTNIYLGSTIGATIIVPYAGDYELTAYDQYDNILGTSTIYQEDFRQNDAATIKYAKVMFGATMDLADDISEGDNDNACRLDPVVEWGGGVSGVYFEARDTGYSQDCEKSHDGYVRDKAAVKITLKPTNMDRVHTIILEKPMPYANRIILGTLDHLEVRNYLCFDEFSGCTEDEDFSIVQ